MDAQTVNFFLVAGVILLLVFSGYAYFVQKDATKAVPPDVVHRVFDTADKLALIALKNSSSTPSMVDDDISTLYLEARGWTVSGSPETGYTATLPPVASPTS